jgi:hypothetical protein
VLGKLDGVTRRGPKNRGRGYSFVRDRIRGDCRHEPQDHTFVWDDRHRSFTNSGYYSVPLGSNNLPLTNSLGDGNAPRNSERAAPFWNTDMALMKHFDLPGTTKFTVRVDAFNLFNQDNYGAPVNIMSNTSFGQNTNNWGRRIFQLSGKFTF